MARPQRFPGPWTAGELTARSSWPQKGARLAAVKRDLIGELPKMHRAGRTDVSDLAVSMNTLTPVSEPLYAVA